MNETRALRLKPAGGCELEQATVKLLPSLPCKSLTLKETDTRLNDSAIDGASA